MKTSIKCIALVIGLFCFGLSATQSLKAQGRILPESVFGEWFNSNGNGEYNGMLIHPGFVEYGYKAFMYVDVNKLSDKFYNFTARDNNGHAVSGALQIIGKDSLRLKLDDNPFKGFSKRTTPKYGERISMEQVPSELKGNWFRTDGTNLLNFEVGDKSFVFSGEKYRPVDIIKFNFPRGAEYRFVVGRRNDYYIFYFKEWNGDYLKIGFNGEYGDLYKANSEYPNTKMDDVEAYMASIFPKELRGNWLKTDGSNRWAYGFYYDYAIINKKVWQYKSVVEDGSQVIINLESNGEEKTIKAKPNEDGTVDFIGSDNQKLNCSLTETDNSDFTLAKDPYFEEDGLFVMDSTTYSGIIRNFPKNSPQKTGMVHVNNIFTGNQESFMVKINDEGHFSVKFPLYYPQVIYVRFPGYTSSVFVEPGKETWQLINSNNNDENVFFAGEVAQINTDINRLRGITFDSEFYEFRKGIENVSLNEYRAKCYALHKSHLEKLENAKKSTYISNKAYQYLRLRLDYELYKRILTYDMYQRSGKDQIDSAYIAFLTPDIYNNKLAAITGSYSSFLNRLRFCDAIIPNGLSVPYPDIAVFSEYLINNDIQLSAQEQELLKAFKKHEKDNAPALKKVQDFEEKYEKELGGYYDKYVKVHGRLTEKQRDSIYSLKGGPNLDSIVYYAKKFKMPFTDEEIAAKTARNNLLTKEEKDKISVFHNEFAEERKAFYAAHKAVMNSYNQGEFRKQRLEAYTQFFGQESPWIVDLLIMQTSAGPIYETLSPLTDKGLKESLTMIRSPFLKDYLQYENERAIARIARNKTNSGYVLNETPDTEADKIFDAIMAKYKGKVVFVDFWATWCSPCRAGIKRMKPIKANLKEKDIVYVYITNQTSPETTYNNMIPEIKGEHYRLSTDEWNYLSSKFNITGIPHYTLVNKEGEVVNNNNVGFISTLDSFKQLVGEYL